MRETERAERLAIAVGVVSLGLLLLSLMYSPQQVFRSYLLGFWIWWSILPGALAILLLHDLTGGAWGEEIRRLLRPMARLLPVLALAFVPIAFGLHYIYGWAEPGALVVEAKKQYLTPSFFLFRALLYFVIVSALALGIGAKGEARKGIRSALGLVLYVLIVTFASIDWIMSLDPEWISTAFGLRIVMTQAVGALSLVLLILPFTRRGTAAAELPKALLDLGNLLLAFVMLWAYLAFSQFLIIWSGNLPEEIGWYRARFQGGFQWLALGLVVFHFGVPFLLLLVRELKKRARAVAAIGAGLVALRFLDSFWLVEPAFQKGPQLHWADVVAPIGLGAFLFAAFLRQLRKEHFREA
jgi:hypothetical protein